MCARIQDIDRKKGIGDPFIPLYLGNTAAYVHLPICYATVLHSKKDGGDFKNKYNLFSLLSISHSFHGLFFQVISVKA